MKMNKKIIIIGIILVVLIILYFRWKKFKAMYVANQVATGSSPDSPMSNPSLIDFIAAPITGGGTGGSSTIVPTVDPVINQSDKQALLDGWINQYGLTDIPQNVYDAFLTQPLSQLQQYASYTPTEMVTYINYLQTMLKPIW